jgi:hypothetical protein
VRTTLTIDEDVAVLVQQEVRRKGKSLKATVNDLLRKGLAKDRGEDKQKPFVVQPSFLGLKPGLSYDSIPSLLEELEGPSRR